MLLTNNSDIAIAMENNKNIERVNINNSSVIRYVYLAVCLQMKNYKN